MGPEGALLPRQAALEKQPAAWLWLAYWLWPHWRSSLQHLHVSCGRRVLAQQLWEKGSSERNTQDQGKGLVSSRKVFFLFFFFIAALCFVVFFF